MYTRPLSPETLREVVAKKARMQPRAASTDTLRKMRGLLVSVLIDLFGDDRRHYLVAYLAPESDGSTKSLTASQVSALLDWLGLEKRETRTEGNAIKRIYAYTDKTNLAHTEGEAAIAAYLRERGQLEIDW